MNFKDKIFVAEEKIINQISIWKKAGNKVVFTNGCFDLIHIGHVTYLEEARKQGDVLVVGVNSDASVSRLKGDTRPIKDETNRLSIMASLSCVDMVIMFDEDTPLDLIQLVQPDILVKGGDWNVDQIVGSQVVIDNGGIVKSLKFLKGYSSSALITKIKRED